MPTRNDLSRFTPKLISCLRDGYRSRDLLADLGAGASVTIIAMPLAMALGIASIPQSVAEQMVMIHPWLTPPAVGLFTVVVAGLLISLLGGSRVQIGGPTAAFIPIVFGIASAHGFIGLTTATLMAGLFLVLMGVFRFGTMIKFIPYPVTTGFMTGIAVTIFASQLKDFLGLTIISPEGEAVALPVDFIPRLQLLGANLHTINWHATGVGLGSLAVLLVMRRFLPRIPGAIVAVTLASAFVALMGWASQDSAADVEHARPMIETIGSRFGGIPRTLPSPHLPPLSFELIRDLLPSALTIAVLCAVESLLSAVVADGMTGYRHRSDQELVAQGLANMGSALFFGLPATGAIARTAANIKNGGRTPVAGVVHALGVLFFMVALAPLAKAVPLPALAALLILVSWDISDLGHFRTLLRAPRPDILVLLTTFSLTVLTDLTLGVGFGMVLAAFLFMKRMADVSAIKGLRSSIEEGQELDTPDPKDPGRLAEKSVPPDVEVFEVNGPFFFGVVDKLHDTLHRLERPPRVFILRMRYVPHIDATGLHALDEFIGKCKRQGTILILGGVHAQPLFEMVRAGLDQKIGTENMFDNLDDALTRARQIVEAPAP